MEYKQNTPEWAEMRKNYIGASDASAIMEKSPWKTPYTLWLEKLGFGEEKQMTASMSRGHELEPIARDVFMQETGIIVVPQVVFSSEYKFMMSSLDGMDLDKTTIVEIKCPGKVDHECAMDGQIPDKYKPQLTHQMIVTGLKKCFYLSYSETSYKILEVYLDEEEANELIKKEQEFYQCVINMEPPSFTEKDYILRTDQEYIENALRLKHVNLKLKELENEQENLKKWFIDTSGQSNTKGGGITVTKIVRKGTPKYKEIPELKDVNLDLHRGPSSIYWRVS